MNLLSLLTVIFHWKVKLNVCTFCWYVQYFYVLYFRLVQKLITHGTHALFRSQKLTLFAIGVRHFDIKFHVLGLPV